MSDATAKYTRTGQRIATIQIVYEVPYDAYLTIKGMPASGPPPGGRYQQVAGPDDTSSKASGRATSGGSSAAGDLPPAFDVMLTFPFASYEGASGFVAATSVVDDTMDALARATLVRAVWERMFSHQTAVFLSFAASGERIE